MNLCNHYVKPHSNFFRRDLLVHYYRVKIHSILHFSIIITSAGSQCAIWRGWWNIMKTHNDEGATPQIYSASCRSHLFGPNVLVRVETCSFYHFFSMWITRFIALILSCHGFLSLNISFKKNINKQIEWFCIDTFENSAIKNVVTYHKSYRA